MGMRIKVGYGYAYVLEDGSVCHWAAATEGALGPKPSTDATIKPVVLVPLAEWRLLKLVREPKRSLARRF